MTPQILKAKRLKKRFYALNRKNLMKNLWYSQDSGMPVIPFLILWHKIFVIDNNKIDCLLISLI